MLEMSCFFTPKYFIIYLLKTGTVWYLLWTALNSTHSQNSCSPGTQEHYLIWKWNDELCDSIVLKHPIYCILLWKPMHKYPLHIKYRKFNISITQYLKYTLYSNFINFPSNIPCRFFLKPSANSELHIAFCCHISSSFPLTQSFSLCRHWQFWWI